MMREDYLKNNKPGLWNRMILHAELTNHLNEIDMIARERLENLLPDLMKNAGVTEEMKQKNQLKWVGLANACKAQAEEIILNEIIYN